jgi:hypothetical protein
LGYATHAIERHPSHALLTASGAVSKRASSWDRTGANRDYVPVLPGATVTLLETDRPGCVNHLYLVIGFNELTDYRDAILRCYWDGETAPSVEVPMGDFFALTHCRVRTFTSRFAAVNPGDGCAHALNAYFPMPFDRALITLEQRGPRPLGGAIPGLWFHVDYDTYDEPLPPGTLRFHAQWRQERPTSAVGERNVQLHGGTNLDGAENYVALDVLGAGHMVGLVLEVDNPHAGWFGEGDDMVFVDGDTWPPSIPGTGTEEIFGAAASPTLEFAGLYTGYHLIEHADYSGATGMYRWFAEDPIRFKESLRWTIEHGHANNFAIDYASVAYWYQTEPHAPFPALPSREAMLPVFGPGYEEARAALAPLAERAVATVRTDPTYFDRLASVARRYYHGDFAGFLDELARSGLAAP